MNRAVAARLALVVFLGLGSPAAWAEFSVLAGTFYGTEPTSHGLHGLCLNDPDDNPYIASTTFTVNQSGQYRIASAQYGIGVDVWFAIYTGAFNPNNPAAGRLAQQTRQAWDFDEPVTVNLQSGTNYRLVVSPWCSPDRGAWTLAFTGPGRVTSGARVNNLDTFLSGTLTNGGQTANMGCGNKPFRESGAQRVDTSGKYYVTDVSYFFGLGLCIGVYTAPFNPANPAANRILLLTTDYFDSVQLETGRNYYFVIQANTLAQTGDYLYLVLPGTDFYIDPVLSGAWYEPATAGQGFFLDVLGHERLMFVGWFTWDLQRPAGNVQAQMGDPGHRWLTLFGNFAEAGASLDLQVSRGGVFDQGVAVNTVVDGSVEFEFFDCNSGRVTYDLGTAGGSGVIPIERVTTINLRACETLMQRSGKPRKLNRN